MDFASLWQGLNDACDMSLSGRLFFCNLIKSWFHGEGASEVKNFRRSVHLRTNVSLFLISDLAMAGLFSVLTLPSIDLCLE